MKFAHDDTRKYSQHPNAPREHRDVTALGQHIRTRHGISLSQSSSIAAMSLRALSFRRGQASMYTMYSECCAGNACPALVTVREPNNEVGRGPPLAVITREGIEIKINKKR